MIRRRTLFFAVGAIALAFYLVTMPPSITWRNDGVDSGDLATAVAVGGVPHPPGYPTYLVAAGIFKQLPWGDVAYRLNLLSAVSAALAAALISLVIYQTLGQAQSSPEGQPEQQTRILIWFCALAAGLTLAFASTFWSQAVITEVYTLNALFAAGLLYGVLQVTAANKRWLVPALAALFGLSLGNHLSIVFVLPLLLWLLKAYWSRQLVITSALALGLGLLVYLIIPLRAAGLPPVNWGRAITWPNFLWLVRADLYHHFVFALPRHLVPDRTLAELRLVNEAFLWWGLPVGMLGWLRLVRFNPAWGYGSLVVFLLISVYAIGYNTSDSYVLLLPALLMISLWMGWGLFDLSSMLQPFIMSRVKSPYFLGAILLLLPLLSLCLNFADQNLSRDTEANNFAQQSLNLVEPDAMIITDDDPRTFALWYNHYALGLRPDVAIVNVNLLAHAWYRQNLQQTYPQLHLADPANRPTTTLQALVEQNLVTRPIYLAIIPPLPELRDYQYEPLEHLQQVIEPATPR